MAQQVQLTTYLSSPEQYEEWQLVKEYYGKEMKDAAILRELIRGKAMDIGKGATKRQAIEEIRQEVTQVRQEIDSLRTDMEEKFSRIFAHLGITG